MADLPDSQSKGTKRPMFTPGKNIAIKTPAHEYDSMVAFYESILGFEKLSPTSIDNFPSTVFAFGDKSLWIDCIESLSQAEIWLEIEAEDAEAAKVYLQSKGCRIRNEIEPLPSGFNGFWLNSPSNVIHLVTEEN